MNGKISYIIAYERIEIKTVRKFFLWNLLDVKIRIGNRLYSQPMSFHFRSKIQILKLIKVVKSILQVYVILNEEII